MNDRDRTSRETVRNNFESSYFNEKYDMIDELFGLESQNNSNEKSNGILNEIDSISSSCEPGKFKRMNLSVIHWGKRTRTPRRIPPQIDLAILSRGRIKLPFRNIEWLVENYTRRFPCEWIGKLPNNLSNIFPEVDVTIELFINQHDLNWEEIPVSINSYLSNRHKSEFTNCWDEFYILQIEPAENMRAVEKAIGTNLELLFKKGNVPLPERMKMRDMNRYIIVFYLSFPNQIKKVLREEINAVAKNVLIQGIIEDLKKFIRDIELGRFKQKDLTKARLEKIKCLAKKIKTALERNKNADVYYLSRNPWKRRMVLEKKWIVQDHLIFSACLNKKRKKKRPFSSNFFNIYRNVISPLNRLALDYNKAIMDITTHPFGGPTKQQTIAKMQECKIALKYKRASLDPKSVYSCKPIKKMILERFIDCKA